MVFLTRIALVVLIVQPLLLPKVLPSHGASGLDDYACKASRFLLTVAPCLSLQPMSALGRGCVKTQALDFSVVQKLP
jgi:hypothetical protein